MQHTTKHFREDEMGVVHQPINEQTAVSVTSKAKYQMIVNPRVKQSQEILKPITSNAVSLASHTLWIWIKTSEKTTNHITI